MKLKQRRKLMKRKSIISASLCLLLILGITGTLAFLTDHSDDVTNAFVPGKVTTEIVEEFDGEVKKNVTIINTGNIDAFIRATVVVTWQNEDGEVLGQMPIEKTSSSQNGDYEITWSGLEENGGWTKGDDGFFYHLAPIAGDPDGDGIQTGETTSVLFTDCKLAEGVNPPEGYYLNVEIIGSGIQSIPEDVVQSTWSNDKVTVEVDEGKLSINNKGGN